MNLFRFALPFSKTTDQGLGRGESSSLLSILGGPFSGSTNKYGLFVQLNGSTRSCFQRREGAKSEFLKCALYVKSTPWLTIRFIVLPTDFAFKAREARDRMNQLRNSDLAARADINGLVLVIVCGRA